MEVRIFHIVLHFVAPLLVLWFVSGDRKVLLKTYLILVSTMLVDLDHLLATPIYDPQRCSIGFHPLHGWLAILIYFLLCFPPTTRFYGVGLVIHMGLDSIDCQVTNGIWYYQM